MSEGQTQIISFYEFKDLGDREALEATKAKLKEALVRFDVRGTIIIAGEGYNGMVCGSPAKVVEFVQRVGEILQTDLSIKSSFHDSAPFRKVDVKIKPEIVTLKKSVDMSLAAGTHVSPENWNALISDPDTIVLDARNDYEFITGTFEGALNPNISKFSDLPDFISQSLDPDQHKRVAMFCTGGIRCEKFAPYLKQIGFREVYQLQGGILKYLEKVPADESLWSGECFVFDERRTIDASLNKGKAPDHSQRLSKRKKEKYKLPR